MVEDHKVREVTEEAKDHKDLMVKEECLVLQDLQGHHLLEAREENLDLKDHLVQLAQMVNLDNLE